MKKGLVVLLLLLGLALGLALASFGSLVSTTNVGDSDQPKITENDNAPSFEANLNTQKAYICNGFSDVKSKRVCSEVIFDMVYKAYVQGQAAMVCNFRESENPEFLKDPRMNEYCERAHNLMDEIHILE